MVHQPVHAISAAVTDRLLQRVEHEVRPQGCGDAPAHNAPGEDMVNLGDILMPENSSGYTLISLNNSMANYRFTSKTNSAGELWLIIGTDSNLEGTTSVYYTRINVLFSAP